MAHVPSGDLSRDEWVRVGRALHVATGGAAEGPDAFSAESKKHHNVETVVQRWNSFAAALPTRMAEATLYWLACRNGRPGRTPELPETPHAYYAAVAREDRAKPYAHAARSAGSAGAPAEGGSTESGPAERDATTSAR